MATHADRRGISSTDRPARSAPPPPLDAEPDPHEVARQIALRHLETAPRTRAQLTARLRSRGCDEAVAADVLARLSELGLVDDAAYTEMRVRSRRNGRRLGRAAVREDLRRCGVPEELVLDAVAGIDDESERALADALVGKRLARLAGVDRRVAARRLGALLQRKGFRADIAYAAVRQALAARPEHQRD